MQIDSIIEPYEHRPAACHEYDPRSAEVARTVAALIEPHLPGTVVEHVGSTSVPGCAGKGVVDLMLLYPEGRLAAARDLLDALGFQRQTTRDPFPEERPMRMGSLTYDGTTYNLHVHVIAADSPEAGELRAFRDRLRADPGLVAAYVAAKRAILADGCTDPIDYCYRKGEFVTEALQRSLGTIHVNELPPILVAGLFREINGRLAALLRSLSADDWRRPTSSSQRNVKDVAAHLLDGSLRRLSVQRDGYTPPDAPNGFGSPEELVAYLDRVNGEWTGATRKISPRLLVEWIERSGEELADFFEGLDPFAPALYPVAWAGEEQSANWFDVAREYTEKWHHTQQIFEAVSKPSTITTRRLMHPCLDAFMRALPFTFRKVEAGEGVVVRVTIHGEAGGDWFLVRRGGQWRQVFERSGQAAAAASFGQDSAWKLFTKRMDRETALARFPDVAFEGNRELGLHVLDMVSVMA